MGQEPNEVLGGPLDPNRTIPAATSADRGAGEVRSNAGEPDVATLRGDIEQTRSDIGETLQAIEERLSPGRVASDAAQAVKSTASRKVEHMMNTAGDKANALAEQTRTTVRDNPIPAALIGLGLGWLAYRAFRPTESWRDVDPEWSVYDDDEDYVYGESTTSWGRTLMRAVQDNPIPVAVAGASIGWLVRNARQGGRGDMADWDYASSGENTESRVSEWTESAREAASDARRRVSDVANDARRRVENVTGRTANRIGRISRRAPSEVSRMFNQNPLLFGVAAMAIGAAVGLSVPETETENEWLGEARDRVVERAREVTGQAADATNPPLGG